MRLKVSPSGTPKLRLPTATSYLPLTDRERERKTETETDRERHTEREEEVRTVDTEQAEGLALRHAKAEAVDRHMLPAALLRKHLRACCEREKAKEKEKEKGPERERERERERDRRRNR
jgi:hypothetical protein